MKNLQSYSRDEIRTCLKLAGFKTREIHSTEKLRAILADLLQCGDAKPIETQTQSQKEAA